MLLSVTGTINAYRSYTCIYILQRDKHNYMTIPLFSRRHNLTHVKKVEAQVPAAVVVHQSRRLKVYGTVAQLLLVHRPLSLSLSHQVPCSILTGESWV